MLWREDKENIFALAGDVGALSRGLGAGTQAAAPAGGKGEDLLLVPLGQWLWGQLKAPASQASAQNFLPALFALDRYSFISFYTHLPAEGRAGTESSATPLG